MSPRFIASLPEDKQANFSALLYQNLGPVVNPIARNMGSLGGKIKGGGAAVLTSMVNDAPTLAYAYSFGDRITLSVNTENGALSLGDLLGGSSSLALKGLLGGAMKQ